MMPEQPLRLAKPETSQDSAYLKMRYEEDAEHARLHETLRAAVTSLMMALIAGLLAFAVQDQQDTTGKQWVMGVLVCGASVLGILFNYAHHSRYEMHLNKLRAFRNALEEDLSPNLGSSIKPVIDSISKKGWLRLHVLWLLIYVFTCAIGGAMIMLSTAPEAICHRAQPILNCPLK